MLPSKELKALDARLANVEGLLGRLVLLLGALVRHSCAPGCGDIVEAQGSLALHHVAECPVAQREQAARAATAGKAGGSN